jgi:hypothetical protein
MVAVEWRVAVLAARVLTRHASHTPRAARIGAVRDIVDLRRWLGLGVRIG